MVSFAWKYWLKWGVLALGLFAVCAKPAMARHAAVHTFTGTDGSGPASLTRVGQTLYGTTTFGGVGQTCCGTISKFDPATSVLTVLHRFSGGDGDGATPTAAVIEVGGLLYGTTQAGGTTQPCDDQEAKGCGTIFVFDPLTGVERVLYRFQGGDDGATPAGPLIEVGGLLYGTTFGGGGTQCVDVCGTAFSFNPATGVETVLHRFLGGNDGAGPSSGLSRLDSGFLFGTTSGGGAGCSFAYGCGTIFRLDPTSGEVKIVHVFISGVDGVNPWQSMILLHERLWGITAAGGSGTCPNNITGCGTIFVFDPRTNTEAVAHAFQGRDGAEPEATLVYLRGALFGTTVFGGEKCGGSGCGTVFRIDPDTNEIVTVYRFHGVKDGFFPEIGLAHVGNRLFGSTSSGGVTNSGTAQGTLFEIKP